MTQQTSSAEPETVTSIWGSNQRVRMAGFGGVLGGTILAFLSISRTGLGFDPGPINLVYPLGYILMAVALLAGNARYEGGYGSRGSSVALLLALSLVSYTAPTLVIVLSMSALGFSAGPFTGLIGIAFFATRILGTGYGVVLWRRTKVSRVTAGLFAAILPSTFVLGPLALLGVPAFGIETPVYLAFIAFGYGLLTEPSSSG